MSLRLVHYQEEPPLAADVNVEQEILLPDYLPGVFKILASGLQPELTLEQTQPTRVQIEGAARLWVLYTSDQDEEIHLAEHTAQLSKSVDLPWDESRPAPSLSWQLQSASLSARPSDCRRISCRGGVVVRVQLSCLEEEALPPGFPGLECRTAPLTHCVWRTRAHQSFSVRDELELSPGDGEPQRVLLAQGTGLCGEGKILAGKAVLKGTLALEVLWYDEQKELRQSRFELPVSQMLDVPGLCPDDSVQWSLSVGRVSLRPEENRPDCLELQAQLCASVFAVRSASLNLAEDGYSTEYETVLERAQARVLQLCGTARRQKSVVHTVSLGDSRPQIVYWAGVMLDPCSLQEGQAQAAAHLCALLGDEDGCCRSVCADFRVSVPLDEAAQGEKLFCLEPTLTQTGLSYRLTGDGRLELTLSLELSGLLFSVREVSYLTKAEADVSRPLARPEDLAMKLLLCTEGESLWEIAKRCHTSMESIRQANENVTETPALGTALLVPIRTGLSETDLQEG